MVIFKVSPSMAACTQTDAILVDPLLSMTQLCWMSSGLPFVAVLLPNISLTDRHGVSF